MTEDAASTSRLWGLLRPPFDSVRAAEALLGLSPGAAKVMAGALHATSPEAIALLFQMPRTIRSLSIATTARPERCYGELRGPILWGETMAVRAASADDANHVVCAIAQRAYDTPENRLLAAALDSIVRAAETVTRGNIGGTDTGLARQSRRVAGQAKRFLDHRSLSGVPRRRPAPREIRRVRLGKRTRLYRPALAVLARADNPIEPDDVAAMVDPETAAEHALVVAVVDAWRARGGRFAGFDVHHRGIDSEIVTYRHARHAAKGRTGVFVADVRLHVGATPAELAAALEHYVTR